MWWYLFESRYVEIDLKTDKKHKIYIFCNIIVSADSDLVPSLVIKNKMYVNVLL